MNSLTGVPYVLQLVWLFGSLVEVLVLFYWIMFSVLVVRTVSLSALMLGLASITVTTLKMLV